MKIARIIIALLAAITVCIVLSASVEAAERRLALVIGNAAYQNAPLKNTINDANDMEKMLKTVGFDVIARVNATQQNMEEAIREFGKKLSKTDVGLFYFSGHGVQYKGENYLLPINDTGITDTNIKYKTVPVGIVLEEMTNAGNNLNIVILDACRNYPSSWSKSSVRGLADMKASSGMLIAYATSPDSTASDGSGRNGTYTANLLKNIATPGLHLLMFFQEVRKATLIDSGNQQRPWESVSITDDFYFVKKDSTQQEPVQPAQQPNLRSKPMTVSDEEVSEAFSLKRDLDGWWRPLEYVKNDFKDNGDKITDLATGLMWQKSGSDYAMNYIKVIDYIEELNHQSFAGYSDWRLPTVDELTSLLTPEKKNGDLYIDPIFNKMQRYCWTSDKRASGGVWRIGFYYGLVVWYDMLNNSYIRAVRSLQ